MVFSLRHASGQGVGRTGGKPRALYCCHQPRGHATSGQGGSSRRSLLNAQLEVYSGTRDEDSMDIDIAKRVSRFQLWLGESSNARKPPTRAAGLVSHIV